MTKIEKKMEEIKQMLTEQKADYDAEVIEFEENDSHTFYQTDKYENRKGYSATFKLVGMENGVEWSEFFNHPTPQGLMSNKSKLGNFIRFYGSYPKVGLKVKAYIDDDGFFRCKFE